MTASNQNLITQSVDAIIRYRDFLQLYVYDCLVVLEQEAAWSWWVESAGVRGLPGCDRHQLVQLGRHFGGHGLERQIALFSS